MLDRTSLAKVKDCLEKGQRFVLTTHVNPDGDGLGSEAAIAAFLTERGKDVYIYNSSPVPANYRFLDPDGNIVVYDSRVHRETLVTADYILILDISDWGRLRQLGADIKDLSIPKICIDHHPGEDNFGDIRLVDVKACSTGEIIHDLIKFCDGQITRHIAEAVYTSILTDTGSFRFSNTNARAFKISAELMEKGAKPDTIYQRVYENQPLSKIRLFGYVLNHLHFEHDQRVAWFTISQEVLDKYGAKSYDTEGFADYPRVIDGVEISVMFIELEKGRVKVSLRSKGRYVINGIAQKFGGGGHPYAAGILLEGEIKEHHPRILQEVADILKD